MKCLKLCTKLYLDKLIVIQYKYNCSQVIIHVDARALIGQELRHILL